MTLVKESGSSSGPLKQWMLAEVQVTMTLIHFDAAILDFCLALSMGGGQTAVGQVGSREKDHG